MLYYFKIKKKLRGWEYSKGLTAEGKQKKMLWEIEPLGNLATLGKASVSGEVGSQAAQDQRMTEWQREAVSVASSFRTQ